jgi:hypothetical protein
MGGLTLSLPKWISQSAESDSLKRGLNRLCAKGLISHVKQLRVPPLLNGMELHDRDEQLSEAMGHIEACLTGNSDNRRPVRVFSGFPGSGKTRMLLECCQLVEEVLGLFVTFNSDYSVLEANKGTTRDEQLLAMGIEMPVIARLLHYYFSSDTPWSEWCSQFLALKLSSESFRLSSVLDFFRSCFDKTSIVLAVDETLMLWNKGVADESVTNRLVERLYILQNPGNTAVFFSALAHGFLSVSQTNSERPILPFRLPHLEPTSTIDILRTAFDAAPLKTDQ